MFVAQAIKSTLHLLSRASAASMELAKLAVVFLLVLFSIVGIADSPTLGIEEPVSAGTSGCCVAVSVGLLVVCLLEAVRRGGRGAP